jgi:hypothetical protein
VVVDSSNAAPVVTITGPSGVATFTLQEPGHSQFKLPTASNGWTWQLNWQTVNETTGASLPTGNYTVRVYSGLSDQTFPLTGTITIVLK